MPRTARRVGVFLVVALATLLMLSAGSIPPAPTASVRTAPAASAAPGPTGALPPQLTPSTPGGRVSVAPGFGASPGVTEVGSAPAAAPMTVLVALASQDPSGLSAEVAAEYTPGSGDFHHYLAPSEVASRYGATASSLSAAVGYFEGYGLSAQVLGGDSLVSVTGPTASVAAAFATTFDEYRTAAGPAFVSHPTPATLPSGIPWTGAIGLGNATSPVPLAQPVAGSVDAPSPDTSPQTSCTAGTYGLSPCQVWGAYNSTDLITNGTNGTGERIGIVDVYDGGENQSQLAKDLAAFDTAFHLPTAAVSYNYPVRTSENLNRTSTGWALEEALDLEWAHASAPGASIAMTFGTNSNAGLYEAVDWLVSTDRVDVITMSWGEPDVGVYNAYAGACPSECNASTDGSYEVLGPVLAAAALEGITVLAASGDCGSADGTSGVSTNFPASDPYVTGVGGTHLSVSSSGGYQGETGWSGNSTGASSPGCQNGGGSGGGYAPFARPWWQSGEGLPGSPTTRGVPDVSADASTGVEIIEGGGAGGVGGTSLASPLWAGFAAIADQAVGVPLGFLNPQLYDVLRGSDYAGTFHDVSAGNNGYRAGTGWDPVTGVGTPRLDRLVSALAQASVSPSSLAVVLSAQPLRGPAPLLASFALRSTGGSETYAVEGVYFGDGTAALAPSGSVTHSYPTDGVFPAVGFVDDSSGNTSVSDPVAVVVGGSSLSVTLAATPSDPPVGGTVSFTATVSGGTAPYTYLFTYGDGSYLNNTLVASSTHAFPVAGGFCANVVVTDAASPANGGTSAEVPVAVGGASPPSCPDQTSPLTVQGTSSPPTRDAPADFPSLFQVSGGEGGVVSEQLSSTDPYVAACQCAIFRAPGTFPVTMTALDAQGDRVSNSTNVTVGPGLVGDFSASTQAGPAPLRVDFGATAAGGHDARADATSWSFGDGTSATGAAVAHTYTTPGLYFATADLEDQGQGNASEAFLIDVTEPGAAGPVVSATIEPAVNVTSGTWVRFEATTNDSLPGTLYNWTLGDGSSAWGASLNATLFVPTASSLRSLSVRLEATPATATGAPTVGPIVAQFNDSSFFAVQSDGFVPAASALDLLASGGPTGGVVPLAWSGSAAATGPGSPSVAWQLDGAPVGTSSNLDLTIVQAGVHLLWATATDAWGDSAALPFGVLATSPHPPLVVQASLTPDGGFAPLEVNGSAAAQGGAGAPYGYAWTFGDGGTDSGPLVRHTYPGAGSFEVHLTVNDSAGGTASVYWNVTVLATPPAPPAPAGGGGSPTTDYLLAAVAFAAGVALAGVAWARRRRPPAPTTP